MKPQSVAEPNYDFKLETIQGSSVTDRAFFSSEISILKCIRGSALVSINSERHEFLAGTNFLLVEGMIFKIVACSDDMEVTVLRFSSNFFNEVYSFLDGKSLEVMSYSAPDLYKEEEMEMSDLIFRQLCLLYYRKDHTYRNRIAINLAITYVLEICDQTYKYVKDKVPFIADTRTFLIDRFCILCSEEHAHHRTIEYYADRLNITSRYLHKICRDALQITPKQCIDYMVSGSAKRFLLTTNLTNQQIAHELNFPDQATFGQFFKRNVGMNPSEFRSTYR